MMGIEREETGYERLERRRFEGLVRETGIAVGIFWIAAALYNPVGAVLAWLFVRDGDEDEDDQPAPDYSRAERIPEDYR